MADIQHASLPDDRLHYPKGASTALAGTVLKANGDGTTSFESLALRVSDSITSNSTAAQELATVGETARVYYAGIAETSPAGTISLASDGTITFNAAGVYVIELSANASRSTNAGITTIALTNTYNGVYSDTSRVVTIDSADESFSLSANFSGTFEAEAGDVLTIEMLRVTNGSGQAGLYPITVTDPNFGDVPSAHLSIRKLEA